MRRQPAAAHAAVSGPLPCPGARGQGLQTSDGLPAGEHHRGPSQTAETPPAWRLSSADVSYAVLLLGGGPCSAQEIRQPNSGESASPGPEEINVLSSVCTPMCN